MIEFNYLKFKNILSYGERETVFEFNNGLSVIIAGNGLGKSSICDALTFCLFGKPYRDITIKNLINWHNKKNLSTEINFSSNQDNYTIKRTLAPDSLEVIKNDISMTDLSSKSLMQDEIDKILGINYKLFKQIISLSVNYNKSFLLQTAQEKREMIEQLFQLKIFSQISKVIKKENTELKHSSDINSRELSLLNDSVTLINNKKSEYISLVNTFQTNKQLNVDNLSKQLLEAEKKNKTIINSGKDIKSKLNDNIKTHISRLNKLITEYKDKRNKIKFETDALNKELKFLSNNDICPTCKVTFDPINKMEEISSINIKINQLQLSTTKYDRIIKRIEKIEERCGKLYEQDLTYRSKLDMLKNDYKNNERIVKNLQDRIETEKATELDLDMNKVEEELSEKKSQLNIVRDKYDETTKSLKINKILDEIFSDSGIKTHFFNNIIPILNFKVNEYIQKFELPIKLEFNNEMEEKISNFEYKNRVCDFNSFSEGQKKRIELSILFSFIDINKIISNWDCNILFIDELLDTSIDEEGLNIAISILKDKIYEKGMGIYIISHKTNNTTSFKNVFKVEKNTNGFSVLTKV